MANDQPIIVKRISRKAAAHHGGSWKIAFADFAVAMMAFFLVMWLVTVATPGQRAMVSGYFNDPIGFSEGGSPYAIDLGGSPTVAPQKTLNDLPEQVEAPLQLDNETIADLAEMAEQQELDVLLQELQNKIDAEPVLQRFKDQILLEITQDGLRIQIVDAENRPMFASGSPQLQSYFEDILLALADTISSVPKKISIGGHTDAKPFSGRLSYGNWELSAERANAARRTLVVAGYPESQVARVVGYADSALFDRNDPTNPINRRIDIVVLNKRAEAQLLEGTTDQAEPDAVPNDAPLINAVPSVPGRFEDVSEGQGTVAPAPAQPESAPQTRPANLFDDPGSLRRLGEP
ncbi:MULTISPECIES: flagellar motor protein MotB [Pseudomonas]|uniref:flagellar motor protein MotB n=1 Tax=Pseudomonas TaxID=286 RepID=UPI0013A776AC|nr:flagellar motor protein MotB [Pseudomonas sp. OIL-1]QIB52961.1 flagellar motor protein MotB [Pseudomonas sp. OIL-1]